jgi:hypothetical protein
MSDATIKTKILEAVDKFEEDLHLHGDPVHGLNAKYAYEKLRTDIEKAFEDDNEESSSLPDQVYRRNARREYRRPR